MSTSDAVVRYSADHLDYAKDSGLMHLDGHARMSLSSWTVHGDEMWFNTREETGSFQGRLIAQSSGSALSGDAGTYDFKTDTGTISNCLGQHGTWFVRASTAALEPGRRIDYQNADYTSCNYPSPHYHVHSNHLRVVPNSYLLAGPSTIYVDSVPVFYSPFFYHTLTPDDDRFIRVRAQPGIDKRNGGFIQATTYLGNNPALYGKIFSDYYSLQGLGLGGELDRKEGQDSRGTLYGYHIRENSGADRWDLNGTDFQALSKSVYFQGRLQKQSDASFFNDYGRSNVTPVASYLLNNAALVYHEPVYSLRLSYSREDDINSATAGSPRPSFYLASENPHVDFQTTPLKFGGLPWLNTFSASLSDAYNASDPFYQQSVGAGWEGATTVHLARSLSFVPKLDYSQSYDNRFDDGFPNGGVVRSTDSFIGHYGGSGDVRWYSPVGNWDFTQSYVRRQAAGTLSNDTLANDRGVEQNVTTIEDAIRPSRQIYAQILSGYDYRVFRDHTVGFRDRVQPIQGNLYYTPTSSLTFTVNEFYKLDGGNQSTIVNAEVGNPLSEFVGGGFGYNVSSSVYVLAGRAGWVSPLKTWRITALVNSGFSSNGGIERLNRFTLFDKEITITHSWHDFVGRLIFMTRPGRVEEIAVRLSFRIPPGSEDKAKANSRAWEGEWYPDRQNDLSDRP